MARARSNYRQVRVTITEEAGGYVTVRVMAKPLAADWSMRDTVWHHRWKRTTDSPHWAVLVEEALSEVLMMRTLPAE